MSATQGGRSLSGSPMVEPQMQEDEWQASHAAHEGVGWLSCAPKVYRAGDRPAGGSSPQLASAPGAGLACGLLSGAAPPRRGSSQLESPRSAQQRAGCLQDGGGEGGGGGGGGGGGAPPGRQGLGGCQMAWWGDARQAAMPACRQGATQVPGCHKLQPGKPTQQPTHPPTHPSPATHPPTPASQLTHAQHHEAGGAPLGALHAAAGHNLPIHSLKGVHQGSCYPLLLLQNRGGGALACRAGQEERGAGCSGMVWMRAADSWAVHTQLPPGNSQLQSSTARLGGPLPHTHLCRCASRFPPPANGAGGPRRGRQPRRRCGRQTPRHRLGTRRPVGWAVGRGVRGAGDEGW